jgi:hypothetical protein
MDLTWRFLHNSYASRKWVSNSVLNTWRSRNIVASRETKLIGVICLNLKKWLKETIDNSPWLPQETKEACTKIIEKEKK